MTQMHFPIIKELCYPERVKFESPKISYENFENSLSAILSKTTFHAGELQALFLAIVQCMEPWVYLKTNIKLVDADHLPFYGGEKIEMIFQGDNALNYYFNKEKEGIYFIEKLFRKMSQKGGDNEEKNILENLLLEKPFLPEMYDAFHTFSHYFGITDFDFNLLLKTDDSHRYEIIEKYATESVIEILDLITENLDAIYLLAGKEDILQTLFSTIKNVSKVNVQLDYESPKLKETKEIMALPYFSFSLQMIQSEGEQKAGREANEILAKRILANISDLRFESDKITFIPYLYFFSKKTNLLHHIYCSSFEINLKNKIQNLCLQLSEKLYHHKMKEKITEVLYNHICHYKKNIIYQQIPLLHSTADEKRSDFPYQLITIPKKWKKSDLSCQTSPSLYLYHEMEEVLNHGIITEHIKNLENRYHFIEIDQTRAFICRNDTYRIDYNTISVKRKFNLNHVQLDGVEDILEVCPTLLTLKIIRIYDSQYQKLTRIVSRPYEIKFDDSKIILRSYHRRVLIHQLIKELFDNNHFLPWYCQEYERKICKIIFLIYLYQIRQFDFLKRMLDRPEAVDLKYEIFLNYRYKINSFYHLIWLEEDSHQHYYEISYFIKFFVLMEDIIERDGAQIEKIMEEYQRSYGWVQKINREELVKEYYKFKNYLKKVMHLLKK